MQIRGIFSGRSKKELASNPAQRVSAMVLADRSAVAERRPMLSDIGQQSAVSAPEMPTQIRPSTKVPAPASTLVRASAPVGQVKVKSSSEDRLKVKPTQGKSKAPARKAQGTAPAVPKSPVLEELSITNFKSFAKSKKLSVARAKDKFANPLTEANWETWQAGATFVQSCFQKKVESFSAERARIEAEMASLCLQPLNAHISDNAGDTMVVIIRRLAHELAKSAPEHALPSQAIQYLADQGLASSGFKPTRKSS